MGVLTAVPALTLAAALAGLAAQVDVTVAKDMAAEQSRKQASEHYRKGIALMRDEAWEDAAREFRTATRLDPLMVLAHYGLGQCRMNLKEYPEAVDAFLACREAHRKLTGMQYTDRAMTDQRREDEIRELKESIRMFQAGNVKTTSPQNTVLRLESRLQQLESDRRRGATLDQTPAEFSLALGSAYFRSGKLEDADREYREALKANPKMGEAHNNLAFILMVNGRLEEAESELKAAEKSGFAVNPRFKDDLKKRKAEAEKR